MSTSADLQIATEAAPQIRSLHRVDLRERHGSRTGFPAHGSFPDGRNTDSPKASEDMQELAHVKKLLTTQEAARQIAQAKVVDVSRQLRQSEGENTRIRGELRKSRDDLALTQLEHTYDLRQVAEREASLWNELADVRGKASVSDDEVSQYKKKLIAVSLVLAVPALLWAATLYGRVSPAQAHVPLPTSASTGTPKPATSDFSAGVGRLNRVLEKLKNEKAEDVLKRVHKANAEHGASVCSFEWNGGEVSLVFGGNPNMGIGASMAQCADAVEKAAR